MSTQLLAPQTPLLPLYERQQGGGGGGTGASVGGSQLKSQFPPALLPTDASSGQGGGVQGDGVQEL